MLPLCIPVYKFLCLVNSLPVFITFPTLNATSYQHLSMDRIQHAIPYELDHAFTPRVFKLMSADWLTLEKQILVGQIVHRFKD